jgi:hypothetical protein
MQQSGLVQDVPDPAGGPEVFRANAVEQIVPADHDQSDAGDRPPRQIDEAAQHHHRGSNRPDHLAHEEIQIETERPGQANDGEFDEDEPEAAREQEPAHLAGSATPRPVEIRRNAGEKDEQRRAVMRDPACQEQRRAGDIAWVHAGRTEEVPRVIKRHQDHDRTAQKVDRIDARADGD